MQKSAETYLCDPFGNYIKFKINRSHALTKRDFFLVDAHLPSVVIYKKPCEERTCIMTIEFLFSDVRGIKKNGNKIQIFDKTDLEIPIYIFHLMYSIFHIHWLNEDIYSVHSACISRKGYTMLLMGHSGVGKTSISINLLKKYGFKLVCSDRTLLRINKDGELTPVGGTKIVTYKRKDININVVSDIFETGTNYIDREVKKIISEYIFDGYPKKIDAIAIVRLSNFPKKINNFVPFEALVSLYPYFLDYWNSDALLFEGLEIYSGTNIKLRTKRKILLGLKKSISKTQIVSVSGSLEHISHELDMLAK